MQMRVEATCRLCAARGIKTAAQIADHIEPVSKGATLQEKSDRMWCGELQSLCHACHVSVKAQTERHGFSREIGLDGYPTDAGHPVYACDKRVD
jgi:5-methylcytosine-specific restriction enzyme A